MIEEAGQHFIGLMSGTSIDGVDGVLVDFDLRGNLVATLAVASRPMPAGLRRQLTELQQPGSNEFAAGALAANDLADLYADCVGDLLAQAGLDPSTVTASMPVASASRAPLINWMV